MTIPIFCELNLLTEIYSGELWVNTLLETLRGNFTCDCDLECLKENSVFSTAAMPWPVVGEAMFTDKYNRKNIALLMD